MNLTIWYWQRIYFRRFWLGTWRMKVAMLTRQYWENTRDALKLFDWPWVTRFRSSSRALTRTADENWAPLFPKKSKLFLTIALTPALNNWVSQITEFSNKFEQWLIVLTHAVLLFRAVSFIAILSIFTRYGIGASSRSNTLISRANTGCTATPRWPARPTTIHFCENKKRNIAKRQISSSYLSNSNEFY